MLRGARGGAAGGIGAGADAIARRGLSSLGVAGAVTVLPMLVAGTLGSIGQWAMARYQPTVAQAADRTRSHNPERLSAAQKNLAIVGAAAAGAGASLAGRAKLTPGTGWPLRLAGTAIAGAAGFLAAGAAVRSTQSEPRMYQNRF